MKGIYLLLLTSSVIFIVLGYCFYILNAEPKTSLSSQIQKVDLVEIVPTRVEVKKLEIKSFPFTVQAPLAEWDNPIFQDGCEEASALMVKCALRQVQDEQCPVVDGVINKEWARNKIIDMSDGPVDTSAEDTAKKFLSNIKYQIVDLKSSEELKSGVWIFPMDGRKLGNPYYTAPGPERHMILVIGYDPKTDQVITNDAGTKRGKGYRYDREVFWEAIRDYPTGDHEPITEVRRTGILILGGE